MSKPKNIKELRDQLLEAFELVKADPRRANQTDVLANCAGKILASVKLELEACEMKGVEPDIDFLDYGQKQIPIRPRGASQIGGGKS